MRLDKLTRADVREWLVDCDESGLYSPKLINNALAVLVTCLNQAAEDRLIAVNPAAGIQRLPEGHVERDYLRIEEIDRHLGASSEVYRPLAELLVTCGLRISEALGLIWADVDFDHQVIVVYRQSKAQRGETGATKGQRVRRVEARPDLLKRLADVKATRAEMVAGDIGRQAVFVMPVDHESAHEPHPPNGGLPLDPVRCSSRVH